MLHKRFEYRCFPEILVNNAQRVLLRKGPILAMDGAVMSVMTAGGSGALGFV
jgi:hypothetical protein